MLTQESRPIVRRRIASVDILRGLVMILMALDHTRIFFHAGAQTFDPTDLNFSTPGLFVTRWITHFCAPVFVFLAGTSAFMFGTRRRIPELSFFLLTRGLWLILLEITVINFSFWFDLQFSYTLLQVIWVIGAGLICLSALIYLPLPGILSLGIILVASHNGLNSLIGTPGSPLLRAVWTLVMQPGRLELTDHFSLAVSYPLLPWLGVLLLGYGAGRLYQPDIPAAERLTLLRRCGWGMVGLFVLLRLLNGYGDPHAWSEQDSPVFTLLSFLNVTKYPPSLLYVLITLGPGLLFLHFIEHRRSELTRVFDTFGRVPLFYYILHLYVLHFFALLTALSAGYTWRDFRFGGMSFGPPPEFGYNLPRIYLIWICIVGILYPVCKLYNKLKSRHRVWWMSYL